MQARPTRKPARRRAPAAIRWLAPIVTVLATIPVGSHPALATPFATAANLPYSAFAPGGVNMATGELVLVARPDLVLDGPIPVMFQRYYGSMLSGGGASGRLGPNWRCNFDWSLSVGAVGATVTTDDGQQIVFQPVVGGWALVSPTDHPYRLDFTDVGWRFTDPTRQRVYLFNAGSQMLSVILDSHGSGLSLFYSGPQLMQVNDGSGRSLSFEYNPSGQLAAVNDGTRSVHYGYTGGVLVSVTDAAGGVTNYAYDGSATAVGLLQSVTEPAGNTPVMWSYDPIGRVVSITDAFGHSSSCAWDLPTGNTWTDALGHVRNYAHDAQGRLTSALDPAGGTTAFSYDGLSRLASSTRPLGDITSFTYDAVSGELVSATCGDGSSFTFTYSGHFVMGATFYDLASAHYPDGASESFARDAAGNLTDWTDRGGFHWTATYNTRGEPLTLTNPAGGVTTRTYDLQGNLVSSTDNAGHTTDYSHDGLNRLSEVTLADGSAWQFTRDPLDRPLTVTDAANKAWSLSYDANGRLATATNPLLEHEGFVYDNGDRLVQATDPLGAAREYAYDAAGRLASTTDRTGIVTQYEYDTLGRLVHVADPAGGSRSLTYDGNSRVPAVQDALGRTSSFQYDALDRVIHLTDPAGAGVTFAYDAMGRPLSATGPLGHSKAMSYDARGLATSFHDATSETDFTRTALGEIGQVSDPNHNPWPATYDGDGRMTSSADPLGRTQSFAYDAAGRLTHVTLPIGTGDVGFDAAGRPTSLGYTDGTLLSFAWDDANRLTGGTGVSFAYDAAGRMMTSNGLVIARDAEGRIISESYGPANLVSYAYNTRGLLASMTDWLGGVTSFAYDTTGAIVSLTRPNGTSASYQYDSAGRLADLVERKPGPMNTPANAHVAITRDVLGQAISLERMQPLMPGVSSSSSTNVSYDAASQLSGGTYDARGRMTAEGGRQFQWDGASRLTNLDPGVPGQPAAGYSYDAIGHPLSRVAGAESEQYLWNYATGMPTLDVMSQGGSPKTYFIHAPSGLLLYSIDATSGARTFYHYDEEGNTIFLTDDAAAVQTKYAYSPWGDVTTGGAASANPFTFMAAGGVIQLGGGIYRMGGTIYDANAGRVVSSGATSSGGYPGAGNDEPPQFPPGPCTPSWMPLKIGSNPGPPSKGGGGGPPEGGGQGGSGGGLGEQGSRSGLVPVPAGAGVSSFADGMLAGPYPQPWMLNDSGDGDNDVLSDAWETNASMSSLSVDVNCDGITSELAGTIMHEIGHNLGLTHYGLGSSGTSAFDPGHGARESVQNFASPVPLTGSSAPEHQPGRADAAQDGGLLGTGWSMVNGREKGDYRGRPNPPSSEFCPECDLMIRVCAGTHGCALVAGGASQFDPGHYEPKPTLGFPWVVPLFGFTSNGLATIGSATGGAGEGKASVHEIRVGRPSVSDFCPWCVGR